MTKNPLKVKKKKNLLTKNQQVKKARNKVNTNFYKPAGKTQAALYKLVAD